MEETKSYWTAWSPYWSHQEDFFLDLDAINKLSAFITSPALIIGAGQGLLVEQLQKKRLYSRWNRPGSPDDFLRQKKKRIRPHRGRRQEYAFC